MQNVMVKGTKSYDKISYLLEENGARFNSIIKHDYFGFTLKAPSKNIKNVLPILADILKNPTFDEEEIKKERTRLSSQINRVKDQPRIHSLSLFEQLIYPGHPYGLPFPGLETVVKRLKREDLIKWFRKLVGGSNMYIALVGSVSKRVSKRLVEEYFGGIPKRRATKIPKVPNIKFKEPQEMVLTKKFQQSTTVIGFPAVSADHPHFPVLELVSGFTKGDGGRFYDEIRGKRGLAYVVHSLNLARAKGGAFAGLAATAPEKANLTEKILLQEYERLITEPPTKEELARVKSYTTGQRLTRQLRTNLTRASELARVEASGLGLDWYLNYEKGIRAIKIDQFVEVAKKYFKPNNYIKVLIAGAG